MSHVKMEFKHINDWDGDKLAGKLTELSNLGWVVISSQPNNGGGNGAILQRDVDYVQKTIAELVRYINSMQFRINKGVCDYNTSDGVTEEVLKGFIPKIKQHEAEIKLLREDVKDGNN